MELLITIPLLIKATINRVLDAHFKGVYKEHVPLWRTEYAEKWRRTFLNTIVLQIYLYNIGTDIGIMLALGFSGYLRFWLNVESKYLSLKPIGFPRQAQNWK